MKLTIDRSALRPLGHVQSVVERRNKYRYSKRSA